MSTKPAEVSAFEAKTRLSELLRETEAGRSFVIRRRGKVVAQLTPAAQEPRVTEVSRLAESFREIRTRLTGTVKVRKLVEEGRRF
jgi:antitoxin (DNA-binding transcriptional repressor) of toxin-antitoxin stability system